MGATPIPQIRSLLAAAVVRLVSFGIGRLTHGLVRIDARGLRWQRHKASWEFVVDAVDLDVSLSATAAAAFLRDWRHRAGWSGIGRWAVQRQGIEPWFNRTPTKADLFAAAVRRLEGVLLRVAHGTVNVHVVPEAVPRGAKGTSPSAPETILREELDSLSFRVTEATLGFQPSAQARGLTPSLQVTWVSASGHAAIQGFATELFPSWWQSPLVSSLRTNAAARGLERAMAPLLASASVSTGAGAAFARRWSTSSARDPFSAEVGVRCTQLQLELRIGPSDPATPRFCGAFEVVEVSQVFNQEANSLRCLAHGGRAGVHSFPATVSVQDISVSKRNRAPPLVRAVRAHLSVPDALSGLARHWRWLEWLSSVFRERSVAQLRFCRHRSRTSSSSGCRHAGSKRSILPVGSLELFDAGATLGLVDSHGDDAVGQPTEGGVCFGFARLQGPLGRAWRAPLVLEDIRIHVNPKEGPRGREPPSPLSRSWIRIHTVRGLSAREWSIAGVDGVFHPCTFDGVGGAMLCWESWRDRVAESFGAVHGTGTPYCGPWSVLPTAPGSASELARFRATLLPRDRERGVRSIRIVNSNVDADVPFQPWRPWLGPSLHGADLVLDFRDIRVVYAKCVTRGQGDSDEKNVADDGVRGYHSAVSPPPDVRVPTLLARRSSRRLPPIPQLRTQLSESDAGKTYFATHVATVDKASLVLFGNQSPTLAAGSETNAWTLKLSRVSLARMEPTTAQGERTYILVRALAVSETPMRRFGSNHVFPVCDITSTGTTALLTTDVVTEAGEGTLSIVLAVHRMLELLRGGRMRRGESLVPLGAVRSFPITKRSIETLRFLDWMAAYREMLAFPSTDGPKLHRLRLENNRILLATDPVFPTSEATPRNPTSSGASMQGMGIDPTVLYIELDQLGGMDSPARWSVRGLRLHVGNPGSLAGARGLPLVELQNLDSSDRILVRGFPSGLLAAEDELGRAWSSLGASACGGFVPSEFFVGSLHRLLRSLPMGALLAQAAPQWMKQSRAVQRALFGARLPHRWVDHVTTPVLCETRKSLALSANEAVEPPLVRLGWAVHLSGVGIRLPTHIRAAQVAATCALSATRFMSPFSTLDQVLPPYAAETAAQPFRVPERKSVWLSASQVSLALGAHPLDAWLMSSTDARSRWARAQSLSTHAYPRSEATSTSSRAPATEWGHQFLAQEWRVYLRATARIRRRRDFPCLLRVALPSVALDAEWASGSSELHDAMRRASLRIRHPSASVLNSEASAPTVRVDQVALTLSVPPRHPMSAMAPHIQFEVDTVHSIVRPTDLHAWADVARRVARERSDARTSLATMAATLVPDSSSQQSHSSEESFAARLQSTTASSATSAASELHTDSPVGPALASPVRIWPLARLTASLRRIRTTLRWIITSGAGAGDQEDVDVDVHRIELDAWGRDASVAVSTTIAGVEVFVVPTVQAKFLLAAIPSIQAQVDVEPADALCSSSADIGRAAMGAFIVRVQGAVLPVEAAQQWNARGYECPRGDSVFAESRILSNHPLIVGSSDFVALGARLGTSFVREGNLLRFRLARPPTEKLVSLLSPPHDQDRTQNAKPDSVGLDVVAVDVAGLRLEKMEIRLWETSQPRPTLAGLRLRLKALSFGATFFRRRGRLLDPFQTGCVPVPAPDAAVHVMDETRSSRALHAESMRTLGLRSALDPKSRTDLRSQSRGHDSDPSLGRDDRTQWYMAATQTQAQDFSIHVISRVLGPDAPAGATRFRSPRERAEDPAGARAMRAAEDVRNAPSDAVGGGSGGGAGGALSRRQTGRGERAPRPVSEASTGHHREANASARGGRLLLLCERFAFRQADPSAMDTMSASSTVHDALYTTEISTLRILVNLADREPLFDLADAFSREAFALIPELAQPPWERLQANPLGASASSDLPVSDAELSLAASFDLDPAAWRNLIYVCADDLQVGVVDEGAVAFGLLSLQTIDIVAKTTPASDMDHVIVKVEGTSLFVAPATIDALIPVEGRWVPRSVPASSPGPSAAPSGESRPRERAVVERGEDRASVRPQRGAGETPGIDSGGVPGATVRGREMLLPGGARLPLHSSGIRLGTDRLEEGDGDGTTSSDTSGERGLQQWEVGETEHRAPASASSTGSAADVHHGGFDQLNRSSIGVLTNVVQPMRILVVVTVAHLDRKPREGTILVPTLPPPPSAYDMMSARLEVRVPTIRVTVDADVVRLLHRLVGSAARLPTKLQSRGRALQEQELLASLSMDVRPQATLEALRASFDSFQGIRHQIEKLDHLRAVLRIRAREDASSRRTEGLPRSVHALFESLTAWRRELLASAETSREKTNYLLNKALGDARTTPNVALEVNVHRFAAAFFRATYGARSTARATTPRRAPAVGMLEDEHAMFASVSLDCVDLSVEIREDQSGQGHASLGNVAVNDCLPNAPFPSVIEPQTGHPRYALALAEADASRGIGMSAAGRPETRALGSESRRLEDRRRILAYLGLGQAEERRPQAHERVASGASRAVPLKRSESFTPGTAARDGVTGDDDDGDGEPTRSTGPWRAGSKGPRRPRGASDIFLGGTPLVSEGMGADELVEGADDLHATRATSTSGRMETSILPHFLSSREPEAPGLAVVQRLLRKLTRAHRALVAQGDDLLGTLVRHRREKRSVRSGWGRQTEQRTEGAGMDAYLGLSNEIFLALVCPLQHAQGLTVPDSTEAHSTEAAEAEAGSFEGSVRSFIARTLGQVQTPKLIRIQWELGKPAGGLLVLNHAELRILPLRVGLTAAWITEFSRLVPVADPSQVGVGASGVQAGEMYARPRSEGKSSAPRHRLSHVRLGQSPDRDTYLRAFRSPHPPRVGSSADPESDAEVTGNPASDDFVSSPTTTAPRAQRSRHRTNDELDWSESDEAAARIFFRMRSDRRARLQTLRLHLNPYAMRSAGAKEPIGAEHSSAIEMRRVRHSQHQDTRLVFLIDPFSWIPGVGAFDDDGILTPRRQGRAALESPRSSKARGTIHRYLPHRMAARGGTLAPSRFLVQLGGRVDDLPASRLDGARAESIVGVLLAAILNAWAGDGRSIGHAIAATSGVMKPASVREPSEAGATRLQASVPVASAATRGVDTETRPEAAGNDAADMVLRASQTVIIKHIRIDEIEVGFSFEGDVGMGLADVRGVVLVVHPVTYRSKTWTLNQLFTQLQRDVLLDILSQATRNLRNVGVYLGIVSGDRAMVGPERGRDVPGEEGSSTPGGRPQ